MLCDEILASAVTAHSNPHDVAHTLGLRQFASRIRRAVRYNLERDVVEAAVTHCMSRPSNLLKVIPLVRPPHRTTWIEWADADKNLALDLLGLGRREGKPFPARVGALLTAVEPGSARFTVELAWIHHDGTPQYAPLMVSFSVLEPWPELDPARMLEDAKVHARNPTCMYHPYRNSPSELAAVAGAACHWILVPSLCSEPYRAWVATLPGSARLLEAVDLNAADDIGPEIMFLMASLLLMNTVNGTRTAAEDRTRLNRARQKRGEAPLLAFSTVRMRLARVERAAAESAVGGSAKARHICRGHAKLRKRADGTARLYWWSDHWRGRGPGKRIAPPITGVRL